jgi:hypothetical protein
LEKFRRLWEGVENKEGWKQVKKHIQGDGLIDQGRIQRSDYHPLINLSPSEEPLSKNTIHSSPDVKAFP